MTQHAKLSEHFADDFAIFLKTLTLIPGQSRMVLREPQLLALAKAVESYHALNELEYRSRTRRLSVTR